MSSPTGPTITRDGRELLLFASNDYLGLATHPSVIEAATEAAVRWGVGTGSARLISGAIDLHDELERAIANLKGTEDAVLFGSGYLANIGAMTVLAGPEDVILSDALNHASLIDGIRLSGAHRHIFGHGNLEELRALLHAHRTARRIIIATDGVFSMDGDLAPLEELATIATASGAILFVDDAHGTGVVGREGRGSTDGLDVPVIMGTLSKALGTNGGFVASTRGFCDLLRNTARTYIFDTAMAPPVAAAGLAAIGVLRSDPSRVDRVIANAHALADGLRARGLSVTPPAAAIVPIVVGTNAAALEASRALEARGILIPAIRPPSVPEGTARLRATLTSEHLPEHIDAAITAIAEVLT